MKQPYKVFKPPFHILKKEKSVKYGVYLQSAPFAPIPLNKIQLWPFKFSSIHAVCLFPQRALFIQSVAHLQT